MDRRSKIWKHIRANVFVGKLLTRYREIRFCKGIVTVLTAEKILNLDSAMRFAAITDLNGKILEGIMKENKSSLESQKQQVKFCKDAAKARKHAKKI